MVVGYLLPLGAVHSGEVGHRIAPHLHRVHRPPVGGGEKDGLNGAALIEYRHPVGVCHGGSNLVGVHLGVGSPAGGGILPGAVGLAAVHVGTQVGLRVTGGLPLHFGIGISAGGHRLGLQGFALKGGGHLGGHHPPQVVVQGHGFHRAVGPLYPYLLGAVQGRLRCNHRAVNGQTAAFHRQSPLPLGHQQQRQQEKGQQQGQGNRRHLSHRKHHPLFLQVMIHSISIFTSSTFHIDCAAKWLYNTV